MRRSTDSIRRVGFEGIFQRVKNTGSPRARGLSPPANRCRRAEGAIRSASRTRSRQDLSAKEDPNYSAVGLASWYGSAFHGRKTANGEIYDMGELTAAHPTLPLPSYVRVTNLANDRSVVVRVNDRGPFAKGRVIDVSASVADMLDFKRAGTAKVKVQYVGPARMDGHDRQMLLASYQGPNRFRPRHALRIEDHVDAQDVVLASLTKPRRNNKSAGSDRSIDVWRPARRCAGDYRPCLCPHDL